MRSTAAERTVVLCGGLGTTCAMWDAQLSALAGGEVVCADHPGHGDAPVIQFESVAELARRVLELVPATRFSFMGLSLGGAIGMRLALDAPARIDRLVLACTSARFADPGFWLDRAQTVRREGLEAIADTILGRWFTPAFSNVQPFRAMLLSTDREGYARCCEVLARWDARMELGEISAPTLVVAGAEDPSTPPSHAELLAERIPHAELAVLAGAAHLANVERPDEFNELLREHL